MSTPKVPSRLRNYDSSAASNMYPRELAEKDGKIYFKDDDGNVKCVNDCADTYTATISTAWTGSAAPYTQTISVPGIKESDNPIVDIISSEDYGLAMDELNDYGKIYRITTADNSITVYASEPTSVALSIQLKRVTER